MLWYGGIIAWWVIIQMDEGTMISWWVLFHMRRSFNGKYETSRKKVYWVYSWNLECWVDGRLLSGESYTMLQPKYTWRGGKKSDAVRNPLNQHERNEATQLLPPQLPNLRWPPGWRRRTSIPQPTPTARMMAPNLSSPTYADCQDDSAEPQFPNLRWLPGWWRRTSVTQPTPTARMMALEKVLFGT